MTDDPTFVPRLAFGLMALSALLVADLRRYGRASPRLREYSFLCATAVAAIAYGIAHDWVTCGLSPDYFSIGKGIASAESGFSADIVLLATKAAFSAGLLVGVALLVANNPRPASPQLPYRTLALQLGWPLGFVMRRAGERNRPWALLASALGLLPAFVGGGVGALWLRSARARTA